MVEVEDWRMRTKKARMSKNRERKWKMEKICVWKEQ